MRWFFVHSLGFILVGCVWVFVYESDFSMLFSLMIAVGGVLLLIPIVFLGRWLLDQQPTIQRAKSVTTAIHYAIAVILGCAIITAVRLAQIWQTWQMSSLAWVGLGLMFFSSALLLLIILNLALKGLGGPFAAALTRSVATEWFYAWTRNPMILSALLLLVGLGIWLQSGLFLIWLVVFVGPAILIFLTIFEERELEIRFGQAYLDYKNRTPRFIPKKPDKG
jgi:protein-S-isoprenylcysteine O-methyltransferase Ste14